MPTHFPFPKVFHFDRAVGQLMFRHKDEAIPARPGALLFEGFAKMHGTNASVVCLPLGDYYYQTRRRVLLEGEDNHGFRAAMEALGKGYARDTVLAMAGVGDPTNLEHPLVAWGEWVGPGVQRGVALSQLDKRRFVVFWTREMLAYNEDGEPIWAPWRRPDPRFHDPMGVIYPIQQVSPRYTLELDLRCPGAAKPYLEELVAEVEAECPVGRHFNAMGVGEGVVFNCTTDGYGSSRYWFKAKGEEHKAAGSKARPNNAGSSPGPSQGVVEFIFQYLDDALFERYLQYLDESGLPRDNTSIGAVIRFGIEDFCEEHELEMATTGLSAKAVKRVLAGELGRRCRLAFA